MKEYSPKNVTEISRKVISKNSFQQKENFSEKNVVEKYKNLKENFN